MSGGSRRQGRSRHSLTTTLDCYLGGDARDPEKPSPDVRPRRSKLAVSKCRRWLRVAIQSALQLQPILLDRAPSDRYRHRLRMFVPAWGPAVDELLGDS